MSLTYFAALCVVFVANTFALCYLIQHGLPGLTVWAFCCVAFGRVLWGCRR